MQSNLYVTNLAYTITDDALRAHFESCGHVNSAQVIVERDTGRARGFGFVEMGSDSEAQEAIQKLHEQPLGGRMIGVALARARK
ncbi:MULTISPECIES: RNA recognition motif domain-containing protein [Comamonas]|jgi:RNA recognition motif-containing protein|uniref:RNA-binding protein n=1 Tax=Comamonas terrigena TaxID=32013 RepID=A0A2A7UX02_COMTR|nr:MULTISPECIES: RNA-binding protein [Comamonas]MBD9531302.1 RNA-binding protein [Comamonas sp. CMM01]MBV7417294.1 RNA-binding protein [Comamonas sp. CMM03]MDH0051132.1 RNA-binding protein [Comamonas terrigena]MDH0513583.1 RNA-binding protein [Comamonas terrigena]MDH1093076.1 RNA-binding protein [Comamonas terrigena]